MIFYIFKVETIGDAYMVVGGVPEVIPDHAQRIANQGMDMILKAGEVKSPATGKALQVSEHKQQDFHIKNRYQQPASSESPLVPPSVTGS